MSGRGKGRKGLGEGGARRHRKALHRKALHRKALLRKALHRKALHRKALHRKDLHRKARHRKALHRRALGGHMQGIARHSPPRSPWRCAERLSGVIAGLIHEEARRTGRRRLGAPGAGDRRRRASIWRHRRPHPLGTSSTGRRAPEATPRTRSAPRAPGGLGHPPSGLMASPRGSERTERLPSWIRLGSVDPTRIRGSDSDPWIRVDAPLGVSLESRDAVARTERA